MRRLLWVLFGASLCLMATLGGTSCTPIEETPGGGGGVGNTVDVRSTPAGARIYVDGDDTGLTTPATVEGLTASATGISHAIGLRMAGYHSYGAVVTLYSLSTRAATTVSAALSPTGEAGGDLYVQTSPSGASIALDGVPTGETTPAVFTNLGATRHSIEVALGGWDRRVEAATVREGEETAVELLLERTGRSAVSGAVYDKINRGLLVGATVTLEGTGRTTETTLQGSYVFEDVAPGYYDVTARKVLSVGAVLVGRRENVYVDPDNGRMMAADILLAENAEMGSVGGRVLDQASRAIDNAYVYLDMNNAVYFCPVDESTGEFFFPSVPRNPTDADYRLVASAPGFANGASVIRVTAGEELRQSLRLADGVTGAPARPTTDGIQALTYPTAEAMTPAGLLGVRRLIEQSAPSPRPERLAMLDRMDEEGLVGTRSFPPAGHLVEVDLYWLANGEANLAGYDVLRSEQSGIGYDVISTLWDPNAVYLADISPNVGAERSVYYRLRAFNLAGDRSTNSAYESVLPLGALEVTSPLPGGAPGSPVTFRWRPLERVGFYGAYVFSSLPDRDIGRVNPLLWSNADIAPDATSIQFGHGGEPSGAHLVSGHDYWFVLYAGDGSNADESSALSFSEIIRFRAP